MTTRTINLVDITYDGDGSSTRINEMGMREMQERAFEKRTAQKLLIKAPPASGKSRALMFVALDKLYNQGIKKVIIAVPERSIGASFRNTELSKFGFFTDWRIKDQNNLCTEDGIEDKSKISAFKRFMDSKDQILLCTHATLRFAFADIPTEKFNDCLLAIDEFHHSSTSNNVLGELLRDVMKDSTAHILAMTGSYFRGDNTPIVSPEDEREFEKVTYTYYEQLNGYTHLKSLGIGYHFYTGSYLDNGALNAVLDVSKKTIIHIPNVNSREATQKGKLEEVGHIYDIIGKFVERDKNGIDILKTANDEIIRIANLVEDEPKHRTTISSYLSKVAQDDIDAVDIIVALNMAKEGFDWPYCEQALTIGYRSSLTEIVQIIGRCTRDSFNKTRAQFTNLIVQPNGAKDEVIVATNQMLKAITASLLMEQVLAPEFKFTPVDNNDTEKYPEPGTIVIKGVKPIDITTPEGRAIDKAIKADLQDLTARILQNDKFQQASAKNEDISYIHAIEKTILQQQYPDFNDEQIEQVRQYVHANMVMKTAPPRSKGDEGARSGILAIGTKFINIDELDINLIDSINPFQQAFEVISKQVDENIFRQIKLALDSTRIEMTEEEALALYPEFQAFVEATGRPPMANSRDKREELLYKFLVFMTRNRHKYINEVSDEK